MHSDLFVATPGEAPQLAASEDPFAVWPSVSLKNVLELEWLGFAKAARTDVFDEPLVEERGCVVRPMTRHVVNRLLTQSADERAALAQAWQQAAFPSWPVAAVEGVLEELKQLAERARADGKAVLYRVSFTSP